MRKTATYVSCDNPDCEQSIAVPDDNLTPEGWYVVVQADEKNHVPTAARFGFTCCSLECLAQWALERDAALVASQIREVK